MRGAVTAPRSAVSRSYDSVIRTYDFGPPPVRPGRFSYEFVADSYAAKTAGPVATSPAYESGAETYEKMSRPPFRVSRPVPRILRRSGRTTKAKGRMTKS